MNQILNLRSITIKLLEENIEVYFHDLGFSNRFLNIISKAQARKEKYINLALSNEKLLCIKGHLPRELKEKTQNGRKYFQIMILIRV